MKLILVDFDFNVLRYFKIYSQKFKKLLNFVQFTLTNYL